MAVSLFLPERGAYPYNSHLPDKPARTSKPLFGSGSWDSTASLMGATAASFNSPNPCNGRYPHSPGQFSGLEKKLPNSAREKVAVTSVGLGSGEFSSGPVPSNSREFGRKGTNNSSSLGESLNVQI